MTKTTKLEDLHWPFNGLLFIFPCQFVLGVQDHIPYLILSRHETGLHRLDSGRPEPHFTFNLEQEVAVLYFTDTSHPTEYTTAWSTGRTLTPLIEQEELENLDDGQPMNDNEDAVSRRIFILAVKLLLVANASPELVIPCEAIPTKKKCAVSDPKDAAALYSPNWYGYPDVAPNEIGSPARPQNDSLSRHSPRFHLRRGHFKKQPHGPHHSLRKITWIKPTTVGGTVRGSH